MIAYALPLAFLLISPVLPWKRAHDLAMTLCIYLLIKWLTDYRKCTVSYIECKLRGVKKEAGYLYRYLEPILNLNRHPDRRVFYFTTGLLVVLNSVARRYLII
jgi:hypothetical protein